MRRMTVIVATFALSSSGMAAELSKNGPVEGRFYSHNVQKIDELQTADGMKAYVNESFAFHVGKQHDGLFDGTTERCLGYGRYSEGGAVKEVGRCTVVDADGDKGIKGTLTVTDEAWPELGKTDTMWADDYKGEYKIGA